MRAYHLLLTGTLATPWAGGSVVAGGAHAGATAPSRGEAATAESGQHPRRQEISEVLLGAQVAQDSSSSIISRIAVR